MCMRKNIKKKHILSAAALALASAAFLTLSGCAGGEDTELTPSLTGGAAESSADGHSSLACLHPTIQLPLVRHLLWMLRLMPQELGRPPLLPFRRPPLLPSCSVTGLLTSAI